MKSFAARLAVVTLAVTGFAASTVVSMAAVNKHDFKVQIGVVGSAPMCSPSSNPNPCKASMD